MKLFAVSFVFQASYWKLISQYAINANSYSFFNLLITVTKSFDTVYSSVTENVAK